MEATRQTLPELNALRLYPVSSPVGRAGYGLSLELALILRIAGFQLLAAGDGLAPGRGPGANLAVAGAAGKVGIGVFRADLFHRAFGPLRARQLVPPKPP